MPARLHGPEAAGQRCRGDDVRWTCALVNNMPDSAFEQTERQFVSLLDAGSGCQTVDVRRYALAGVPRGARTAERIAADYLPLAHLHDQPPDLLIVSGANPLERHIEDEPYWSELADLLRWASEHVGSMLASCLAAHATVAVFDGIPREQLTSKCTGVFTQEVDVAHALATGLPGSSVLPHSRRNDVSLAALEDAGYQVTFRSDEEAWSVATGVIGNSSVVLVQGHPEYAPSSLLREYQRDARRYVQHERDQVPCLPARCVGCGDVARLARLHEQVVERRDPVDVETFPFDEVASRAPWPWRYTATGLYRNWMAGVPRRSRRHHAR
ncbi:MAG: homoserine O-acetyltransferase/O-succinyltransferase family protein [Acidimicrobiales bacterium]